MQIFYAFRQNDKKHFDLSSFENLMKAKLEFFLQIIASDCPCDFLLK